MQSMNRQYASSICVGLQHSNEKQSESVIDMCRFPSYLSVMLTGAQVIGTVSFLG